MSELAWLPQIVVAVLMLLSGAAVGGIFIRRGSFSGTYQLLQRSVETYETLQRLDVQRLNQLIAERDAAEKERAAELARSTRLERMISDCQLDKADLEREIARLRARQQP